MSRIVRLSLTLLFAIMMVIATASAGLAFAPPGNSGISGFDFPANPGWLAYECRGEGPPTVVVELPDVDPSRAERDPNWMAWDGTLDMIAETSKVCIYGRRGVLGSEPVSALPPRTTQDHVDDLNGLIDALELETPVILVGHSLGGFNIRLFAGQKPENVAGLVFVDGTDPGIYEFIPVDEPFPPEWIDFVTSTEQVAAVTDLGDLPVYVLTATIEQAPGAGEPLSVRPDWWYDLQDNLLALSTNSTQTKVEATHTNIWWAKPEALVDAIAWATAQAR
jgi:pimeloyl-ACP methyl ester carboxylesterase